MTAPALTQAPPAWYAAWASDYMTAMGLPATWAAAAFGWWPTLKAMGADAARLASAAAAVRSRPARPKTSDQPPFPNFPTEHLPAIRDELADLVEDERRRQAEARERDYHASADPLVCEECGGTGWAGPVPHPHYLRTGAFLPAKNVRRRPVYATCAVTCRCDAGEKTRGAGGLARQRLSLAEYERRHPGWEATLAEARDAAAPDSELPRVAVDPEGVVAGFAARILRPREAS